jgi:tetratricopeptide (TPR) repeat protein
MPKAPEQRRNESGIRLLAACVFVLTIVVTLGGVMVAKTFLEAPEDAAAAPAPRTPVGPPPKLVDVAAVLSASEQAMQQQKYARAEAILVKAVTDAPFEAELHVALGRALVAQEKFGPAYVQYEAALALAGQAEQPAGAPSDGRIAPKGAGDPRLQFEAGTIAVKAGLYDRAVEHYSMAQAGDATNASYPLYLAMAQIRHGDEQGAAASLLRAVRLDPDLAEAWGTMAELALKNNSLSLAAQHITEARKRQPGVVRWRVVEAKILKRSGKRADVEKAAQLLTAMDRAERLKPEVMSVLAECFGYLRRPEEAAAMYADAVLARPDDAESAYQAAVWFDRAGQREEAAKYARAAAALGHGGAAEMLKGWQ